MEKKREIPRPIHPFPARMAASIPWSELQGGKTSLRVLDPMAGSGTTAVVARQLGHIPIAFDTDPMAVLLAKVWCSDLPESLTPRTAEKALERAKAYVRRIPLGQAYPLNADPETRAFVRYWFDGTNRKQLTALAKAISEVSNTRVRDVLWCAFSRMIITKQAGASLAWDVSHSRPHKVHGKNIIRPLRHFLNAGARTHPKNCSCYKSEDRDSRCAEKWPDLCPWWAHQLQRHVTGNFSGPAPSLD